MNLGYQCTDCGDKYIGAFNFYRHLKYNHEKIRSNNSKNFKCDICSARFSKNLYLTNHFFAVHAQKTLKKTNL